MDIQSPENKVKKKKSYKKPTLTKYEKIKRVQAYF